MVGAADVTGARQVDEQHYLLSRLLSGFLMEQFSVRLSDERGRAVRQLAAARGASINQTFEDLVAAATDPALAGGDRQALRERLARAGLVFDISVVPDVDAPTDAELARARAAAGRGTPLVTLVSEGRR